MSITRRHFLRAAGIALALPRLDAFAAPRRAQPRRRMVCLCAPLGLHPAYFLPEKAGKDYALTPYLEVLKDFRKDFTVVSGLAHVGMSPGFAHQASASFLTGAQGAGRPGFKNTISVDQFAAEHIGGRTRFPSLALSGEGIGLSWTPDRGARASHRVERGGPIGPPDSSDRSAIRGLLRPLTCSVCPPPLMRR